MIVQIKVRDESGRYVQACARCAAPKEESKK